MSGIGAKFNIFYCTTCKSSFRGKQAVMHRKTRGHIFSDELRYCLSCEKGIFTDSNKLKTDFFTKHSHCLQKFNNLSFNKYLINKVFKKKRKKMPGVVHTAFEVKRGGRCSEISVSFLPIGTSSPCLPRSGRGSEDVTGPSTPRRPDTPFGPPLLRDFAFAPRSPCFPRLVEGRATPAGEVSAVGSPETWRPVRPVVESPAHPSDETSPYFSTRCPAGAARASPQSMTVDLTEDDEERENKESEEGRRTTGNKEVEKVLGPWATPAPLLELPVVLKPNVEFWVEERRSIRESDLSPPRREGGTDAGMFATTEPHSRGSGDNCISPVGEEKAEGTERRESAADESLEAPSPPGVKEEPFGVELGPSGPPSCCGLVERFGDGSETVGPTELLTLTILQLQEAKGSGLNDEQLAVVVERLERVRSVVGRPCECQRKMQVHGLAGPWR